MRSIITNSIAILILLSACGGGDPEEQTLSTFFGGVQSGDQAAMDRVSLAAFDGNVETWEIVERGAESAGPFPLQDLVAQLEQEQDGVRAQKQDHQNFLSDNRDTYDTYTRTYAEDPSAPFQGELLVFHERLQQRQLDLAQLEADADQLAFDVEALKNAATLSLRTPVDESFEGQVTAKPLQVRLNDGSGDKTFTVVLQRYDLVNTVQNRTPNPQWIITEIQPPS